MQNANATLLKSPTDRENLQQCFDLVSEALLSMNNLLNIAVAGSSRLVMGPFA